MHSLPSSQTFGGEEKQTLFSWIKSNFKTSREELISRPLQTIGCAVCACFPGDRRRLARFVLRTRAVDFPGKVLIERWKPRSSGLARGGPGGA